MAEFVLLFDDQHLKTYDIQEPVITIGRLPENTISIVNMGVSRRHARIEKDPSGGYQIIDLNSLNGTFVNNRKINKGALGVGDKITIGKYTIIFKNMVPVANDNSSADSREETDFALEPTMESASRQASPHTIQRESPLPSGEQVAGKSDEKQEVLEQDPVETGPVPNCPVLIETNKHVVYRIDKEHFTLGNSENDDIFVDGLFIEEAIVEIEKKDDGVWLTNKKLLGKTKINGKKVKNHLLQHKDRIEIGSSTFRFMENE
ncbi:MAG: FHA domain-containing protein [Chitinivibrionales bacterium]|nr:FHA domain-containing protein [Chitinivibrionales bacterium]